MKGAFTGAVNDFPGMIAAAAGGTLFLDEIGEMPATLQTRFLRVLQEREFRPLGSTKTLKADFRLVAATNQAITRALREGLLRQDLYYRINTFQIEIPPLRDRREDIAPLAALFVKRYAQQMGRPEPQITGEAMARLRRVHLAGERSATAECDRVRSRTGKGEPNRRKQPAAGAPDARAVARSSFSHCRRRAGAWAAKHDGGLDPQPKAGRTRAARDPASARRSARQ